MSQIVLPSLRELGNGFRSSFLVLRTQWKYTRTAKTRIATAIAIVSVVATVAIMVQAGQLVKFAAVEQEGIIQTTAREYLSSFAQGNLGGIGATILGIAILSAIASPFTGATATSFMPPRELSSMSISKWHRFTDSIVAQFMSSISLLQLLTLLILSSMLALDVSPGGGVLLTIFVWFNLVSLTVLSVWVAEYVHRRFGVIVRFALFAGVIAAIGIALLIDPNNGTTVFGLGELYATGITSIRDLSVGAQIGVYSALLTTAALIAYTASAISAGALMLPEQKTSGNTDHRVYRGRFAIKKHSVAHIILRAPMRLAEIRKPILAAIIIGASVMLFSPGTFAIQATITVIIPLVIALAWGSNALSLIGGGMPWLLSQPNGARHLPWVVFGLQVLFGIGLFILISLPSLIIGTVSLSDFAVSLLAITGSTFIIARSATTKSFRKPSTTHYGSRGESTLAPITALQYTMRLALWGGQYGILILSLENTQIRLTMVGAAIAYQIFRMTREQERWTDPQVKRAITVAVSND